MGANRKIKVQSLRKIKRKEESKTEKGKIEAEREKERGCWSGKHYVKEMGWFRGRKFENSLCERKRKMKGIHLSVQALK